MSKLYDVISRLEDVASDNKESQEAALPELNDQSAKEKSPWLRILLFSIVIIALGGITIGATAWLQNWFVDNKSDVSSKNSQINQQAQEALPAGPSIETPGPQTLESKAINQMVERPESPTPVLVEKTTDSFSDSAVSKAGTSEDLTEFTGDMSIDVATDTLTVETLDQFLASEIFDFPEFLEEFSPRETTIFIHPLDIAEVVDDNRSRSMEHSRAESLVSIDENRAKTSRWLHQAELYRHDGEWESAIILYQKVWQLTSDPAVANNLAAALIEQGRPQQALTILKEGLLQAPNDPDIAQNLRLVEQILEMEGS